MPPQRTMPLPHGRASLSIMLQTVAKSYRPIRHTVTRLASVGVKVMDRPAAAATYNIIAAEVGKPVAGLIGGWTKLCNYRERRRGGVSVYPKLDSGTEIGTAPMLS